MSTYPAVDNFSAIFRDGRPLMDVRAPVEFARGAFPAAVNRPLLDDRQREQIGICYSQRGEDAAIELGERLATPEVRAQRLEDWIVYLDRYPAALLYCFRGGLRSQITQRWLADAGYLIPRIHGGYKAMRQYLLSVLEHELPALDCIVLSGRTGSGKTELLRRITPSIDLEDLAGHRGSSFGALSGGQPGQIDFENALAIRLLQLGECDGPVVLEDESHLIGRIALPQCLQERLRAAPVIRLESTLEERVTRITREYILEPWRASLLIYGDPDRALRTYSAQILGNLDRIRKRLGSERHAEVRSCWIAALELLRRHQSPAGFASGIRTLLQAYYDPMYDHQQNRFPRPLLFTGNAAEVADWLQCKRSPGKSVLPSLEFTAPA